MLQTAEPAATTNDQSSAASSAYLEAFRVMLQTRVFEDKLGALYRGGMIVGGVYLGRGQEAVSAACGLSLREGDIFAPLIRDQAGRAAFGEPLLDPARTYLGSSMGPMRGRDGNIHRGRPQNGQLRDDQSSRRDDSGGRRHVAGEALARREGFRRPRDDRRRRHADRRDP